MGAPGRGHEATRRASSGRVGGTAVRRRDPASLTPAERLAELGTILAVGYRRLRLSRQRTLDGSAEVEALCDSAVDGNGAETAGEVA